MARSFSYQWGRINRISSQRNDEEQLTSDLVIVVDDPHTPAASGSAIYTLDRIDTGAMLTALRSGHISAPISSGPLVIAEGCNVYDGQGTPPINLPQGVVASIAITEEPNAEQARVFRVEVTTAAHSDRSALQPASATYQMQAAAVQVQAFRINSDDNPLLFPTDENWTQIGTTLLYKITPARWYDSSYGMGASATVTGDPVQRNSAGTEVGTDRPAGDIGGEYVDWSGKPIQFALPVTTHTVSVVRNAPLLELSGTTPTTTYDYGDQSTIQNQQGFVGCRNVGDMFRTGDAGRILLRSINMTPLGAESFRVTYLFVEHPWRHAIQVPRQTFGSGFFAMKYLGDPRLIQHQIGVYWQQVNQFGANFQDAGVLFTDAELRVISEKYNTDNP